MFLAQNFQRKTWQKIYLDQPDPDVFESPVQIWIWSNIVQIRNTAFQPFLDKSAKNRAVNFHAAPFVFCGRNFYQSVTLFSSNIFLKMHLKLGTLIGRFSNSRYFTDVCYWSASSIGCHVTSVVFYKSCDM
jgi:hypothetical protein